MKIKTINTCKAICLGLSLSAAVIGLSGCAGDRYDRSTGQYIDDSTLKMHVNSALGDNAEYKFDSVNVTVFKGTVQLSGFVNNSDQKAKAGQIASSVQGIRNVANNITVKEGYTDDRSLTSRVNNALKNNSEYKFGDVKVVSMDGTVQLSGFVNTSDQKSKANDIVKHVEGVKNVSNNITVKDNM